MQAENLLREQIENPGSGEIAGRKPVKGTDRKSDGPASLCVCDRFYTGKASADQCGFNGAKPQTADKEHVRADQGDRKYLQEAAEKEACGDV